MNLTTLIILICYFLTLIAIGIYARRKTSTSPEDYFLGGRNFGSVVLFFTLAATNFSAFTFLGFAGQAYTNGMGQYGIMALGTSFMALMFFILGRKIWILGKSNNYMTPGELVGGRYKSRTLQLLITSVMSLFTIPYLAIQAIGAGLIIQMVAPDISMVAGAVITMLVICLYVLSGGMKATGWTDVFQGMLLIAALVIAVLFILGELGGATAITQRSYDVQPTLFSRPGPMGYFTPQIWLSFFFLWIFCDPMFPQIFTRFYTAKSQKSLKHAMMLYPLLISFLFLIPVLIGVWAHGAGITVENPDNVLLAMVKTYTPNIVFSFVIVGALAALMSTADSQLLALSTMITCDIAGKKVRYSKIVTIILTGFAILFVIAGYKSDTGIMGTLVKTTFSGLVVLFPSVFATLYWKRTTKWGCITSIIGGEMIVVASAYTSLPVFGFLPGIFALAVSSLLIILISILTNSNKAVKVATTTK